MKTGEEAMWVVDCKLERDGVSNETGEGASLKT